MKNFGIRKRWIRWILPVVSAAVLAFHVEFVFSAPFFSLRALILFAVLCFFILALNFFTWRAIGSVFQEMDIVREEELTKHRMEHIIQRSKQARENEERVLRLHHDLKNHFGVLYSLLQDGNVQQAEDYIEQIQAFLKQKDERL